MATLENPHRALAVDVVRRVCLAADRAGVVEHTKPDATVYRQLCSWPGAAARTGHWPGRKHGIRHGDSRQPGPFGARTTDAAIRRRLLPDSTVGGHRPYLLGTRPQWRRS